MPDMVLLELEEKMEKIINSLGKEFVQIRTGRASAAILDHISIDYYGAPTPIKQLSAISTPEANQLVIKPFDKSTLKMIEKAINASNLGINPQNDGTIIRLFFPKLTEERRRELAKSLGKYSENAKVAVRNVRREGNDSIKKLSLPEDDEKGYVNDVQDLTDKFSKKVDELTKEKENELMSM